MKLSHITLDKEAIYILSALKKAGFEGYIVGGAVRDLLLGIKSTDYDFTTDAKPEEILSVFPEAFYENDFGTVMITPGDLRLQFGLPERIDESDTTDDSKKLIDLAEATKIHESLEVPAQAGKPEIRDVSSRNYEITTFRSEDAYSDHRRPDKVEWGDTLNEDLERRDFTINAMAIRISDKILNELENADNGFMEIGEENFEIIDPHSGLVDLEAGIISTVGKPADRFEEDALRMLRAIRFSVQLDFKIEDETLEAILEKNILIEHVSFERIRAEFLKMISSDSPKQAIELLDMSGLLQYIIPELQEAKGVEQGGHHTTDVWTHSLDALESCPSPDPIVKLATLLHDVGKPRTYSQENGGITFYNHEVVGSRIAKRIGQRLKLSKKNIDRLFILVRYHMFYYQPENSDASIRRFMRKVGLENIDDILALREGDRLGSGARKTSWRLEEMKERIVEQLHQPMEVKDLAIGGHELMEELELKPGPKIGEILNSLFEEVLENPELNEKDILLKKAKQLAGM